jgi:hypothetical protein
MNRSCSSCGHGEPVRGEGGKGGVLTQAGEGPGVKGMECAVGKGKHDGKGYGTHSATTGPRRSPEHS